MAGSFTTTEVMTVAASRMLRNGQVCFVGIGLPSTASNLARLTHAPEVVLIYESGPIGTRPPILPLSIGDGILAETADTVVSTPEIFRYWLQGGRIDVGFLGAAQIDRFANLNSTVIGPYGRPKVRLPGAGGAPEIASQAREVYVVINHSDRAMMDKLDFISTAGFLTGGDARQKAGIRGKGPSVVITDLCIMRPDAETKELTVTEIHPGITRDKIKEATGWPIRFAAQVEDTAAPRADELEALRALLKRTAEAHGTA
jgi:glutaconate CoA-transferase subunit B